MNLGDLILNIVVDLKNGDVKLKAFGNTVKDTESKFKSAEVANTKFLSGLERSSFRAEALRAIFQLLKGTLGDFINKYNEYTNATLGLESVSKFKGLDPVATVDMVKGLDLVKSGLLSVGDASTSMKNLLASNFTLEQSVQMLQRIGDAAAFGRQSSLSFGEAVRSATEGIKNGNSILVDNSGITKNLSVMLQEAGLKSTDLMNASDNLNVRQALFNGLMNETQGQLGDTNKLMESSQGATIKFNKVVTDIKISFGQLLSSLTPLLAPVSAFLVQLNQMPDRVKTSAMALLALGSAIMMFNQSIPSSVKLLAALASLLIALPPDIRTLVGVVLALVGAVWAYNIAITAAGAATTVATGGLNLALGLLAVGISAVVMSNVNLVDSNAQVKSSLNDISAASSEYNTNIDRANLVKELSSRQTSLTAAEETNYKNALQELSNVYPSVVSGIDSKTGALNVNISALDEVIAKERELAGIELSQKLPETTENIIDMSEGFFESVSNVEKLRKETDNYQDIVNNLNKFLVENSEITESNIDLVKNAVLQRETFTQKLEAANNELSLNEDRNMASLDSVSKLVGEYIKFDKIIPLLSSVTIEAGKNSDAVNLVKMAMGNLRAEGFAAINGINVGLVQHTQSFKVFAESWNEFISAVSSGNIAAVSEIYNRMMSAVSSLKVESDKLSQKISSPSAPKKKTSGKSKEEKDPVDLEIERLKELIDVYNFVDKSRGMDEASVVAHISKYLEQNTLLDKQIVKLKKFQEELSKIDKNKPVLLSPEFDPKRLQQQIKEDVQVMYDEWKKTALKDDGELKKNYNPFDFNKAFKEALELRKNQIGEQLSINDLTNINLTLEEEINRIKSENTRNSQLDIISLQNISALQEDIKKNEEQILSISKAVISARESQIESAIELIDNEFEQKRANINLDFQKQMRSLQDQLSSAKSESEKLALQMEIILQRQRRTKELIKLDDDELASQAEYLYGSVTNSLSNAQIIARIFGRSSDALVEGFQRALSIAQSIRAVFETISIIKGLLSFFGLISTGGASAPLMHSGGILAGMPGADIPIVAQEGEGIINRGAMKNILSRYGSGFFGWLNSGMPMTKYHNGGIVSSLVSSASSLKYILKEVPYVSETDIKGNNIKLTISRVDKLKSNRS